MIKKIVGPAILWLVIIGAALGWYYRDKPIIRRAVREIKIAAATGQDAHTLRVVGDGYIGYFFAQSPEMRKESAPRQITVAYTSDDSDYAARNEKFANKEYDIMMLPINSYLEHGAKHRYPGAIAVAIAESRGADGITAFASDLPTGKVQDLNNANLRVVTTPNSPSSFLADLTKSDLDLFNFMSKPELVTNANGSPDVFKKAKKHEGQVFIMWEPDLSRALRDLPDLRLVWSSDNFRKYIIDVFVIRRDVLKSRPDDVTKFFEAYFAAMRTYAADRSLFVADFKSLTGVKDDQLDKVLRSVEFYDLTENARRMFKIQTSPDLPAEDGVINTILACTDVLRRTGKLSKDDALDAYQLVDSSILEKLAKQMPREIGRKGAQAKTFQSLDEAGWGALKETATMRVEPIPFVVGENLLDEMGKAQLDKVALLIKNNYPDYRIAVRGHTGNGDETENRKLSMARAQAAAQYLSVVHGVDANRLHAEGWGASQPPPRRPEEGERLYRARMARVEFVLLAGTAF